MKKLNKKDLEKFLGDVKKGYNLIAPVELEKNKGSIFSLISDVKDVTLKYRNTKKSVKEIFFPQDETLFFFNTGDVNVIEPSAPVRETVLFGVRSCDLKGIEMFDKVFLEGEYADTYYGSKRKNTIIVSLACFDFEDYCFCESLDIDRTDSPVADAVFYDMGVEYFIAAKSARGEALIKKLEEISAAEQEMFAKRNSSLEKQKKVDVEKALKAIAENFENPVWDEVSDKCIGCSICSYLCPTCHCFDVSDETVKNKGRRYRTWDACMFPKFTIHTSGHNPRTKNSQRMRQRILHKFSYLDKNKNIVACSGCGRCIINCPINLDIREILTRLSTS